MSNVIVNKEKIDLLANAIANKSGEPLTLTLDEMVDAVDGIDTSGGGGTPTLETVTKTYTPTTSQQTDTITPSSGYDGIEEVDVTVDAIPISYDVDDGYDIEYYTDVQNNRHARIKPWLDYNDDGYIAVTQGVNYTTVADLNAIASGTSVTPTESSQTIGGANHMMEGAVTVNAIPSNYVGSGITQRDSTDLSANGATVTAPSGYYASSASKSVASGTEGTPTINVGSLWRGERMITASVTNTGGYISGGTHNADGIILSASDFATGSYTITENDTYDVTDTAEVVVQVEPSLQSKTNISPTTSSQTIEADSGYDGLSSVQINAMPSGTEGTPIATKGAVNNHSIAVTPSVTNSAGYISGGTHNGTAVTVSASELVSGSQTVTENDTYDVTNLAELVVNVSGGGGSTVAVGTKTTTLSASASSISFTSLSGNPTSFVVTSSADQSTGGTKAVAVAYDGTNLFGMDVTTQAENDTGFTKSYSSGTLTITATTATFEANEYKLVYTYGGSSSDIHTADVQVGSGATSITFSSLSGRPLYFSCVFKSSFSTSSGYQRVMDVVNDGSNTYGHAFDSSAKAQTSWTYSYSGGSLTITSSGTNNGGYFHQPGYYQLTYAVDDSAPTYQTKSAYATTSAQTITADNGYDALEQVNLGALSQTNLSAENIKSGTTITINNGNTNVWSVTGTYGGGGTSKNTQVVQGTTRTTSSSMTAIGAELTVSKTGTYDVYWSAFRSNTSSTYTYATQLYVGGSAYGSENATWSNHVQNNHLSNVSLTQNQKIRVYGRESRNQSYYIYAPTLVIVEA